MIARMFARSTRPAPRAADVPATVPAGRRVYAVGDIHGRYDLLTALIRQIADDAADTPIEKRRLVFLGDYCDRGLETREVIDQLLDPGLCIFNPVFLKGNHEDFMLRFLDELRYGPGWFANGGGATLYSYGVRMPPHGCSDMERLASLQSQLKQNLPADHLEFLRGLGRWHVEGDYVFVHAGLRPGVALEAQGDEDILWIREEFLDDDADHGRIVVHGHTIRDKPEIRPNRIGIDTGAFATNILTCLVLEGADRRFLQTSG